MDICIMSKLPSNDRCGNAIYSLCVIACIACCVAFPRLAVIGTFPCMDESIFSYWSRLTWQSINLGEGLPHIGGVLLYPILMAPLHALPGLSLVWLRLFDLGLAICVGGLLSIILWRECGNRWIGLLLSAIFLLAMNRFEVVEAGVKNPITAAFVPLLLAVLLCQRSTITESSKQWWIIGGLVALGVLLRETFLYYAIAGFIAIWCGWGRAAACRYAIGGMVIGAAIIAIVAWGRGGLQPVWQHYANLSNMYANESSRIVNKLIWNSWYAFCTFPQAPVLALLTGFVFYKSRRICQQQKLVLPGGNLRALFWIAVMLLPLTAPLTRPGYIFHFATCLPGCAGLCALAWRRIASLHTMQSLKIPALGAMGLALCVAVAGLVLTPQISSWQIGMSRDVLADFPNERTWPQKYDSYSNTLLAGKILRKVLPEEGGTVSTNGHCFFIYDVSLAMPPFDMSFAPQNTFLYSDLARSFSVFDKQPARLADALLANPPDALALAFTHDDHESTFSEGLTEAVRITGLYEKVATVPIDREKDYGWLGYDIYRLSNEAKKELHKPNIVINNS